MLISTHHRYLAFELAVSSARLLHLYFSCASNERMDDQVSVPKKIHREKWLLQMCVHESVDRCDLIVEKTYNRTKYHKVQRWRWSRRRQWQQQRRCHYKNKNICRLIEWTSILVALRSNFAFLVHTLIPNAIAPFFAVRLFNSFPLLISLSRSTMWFSRLDTRL